MGYYFGWHVEGWAEDFVKLILWAEKSGEPEVSQLDLKTPDILNKYILRFDISMDNIVLMHVIQAHENLLGEVLNFSLGKRSLPRCRPLDDIVIKFSISDELRDNKVELVIVEELVHPHDVGVGSFLQNLQLIVH